MFKRFHPSCLLPISFFFFLFLPFCFLELNCHQQYIWLLSYVVSISSRFFKSLCFPCHKWKWEMPIKFVLNPTRDWIQLYFLSLPAAQHVAEFQSLKFCNIICRQLRAISVIFHLLSTLTFLTFVRSWKLLRLSS